MNNATGDPLLDAPQRRPDYSGETRQRAPQPSQPRRDHTRGQHGPSTSTGTPARGFAVTALVTGIIGAAFGLIPLLFVISIPLGIIAAVFGLLAARKNKRNGHPRGMARAGWILGLLAITLGVIGVAIVDQAVEDLDNDLNNIVEDFDTSMAVLDAELHLQSQYTDYANGVDATATAGAVVDGSTTITVTETGTNNVLGTHNVEITDDGRFIILD